MGKRNFITSFCLFIFFSGNLFSSSIKAENFPVYNIKGSRLIFYKILDSLPENAILIINFTSVNCIPCKKEIPELRQIASIFPDKIKLMYIYAETADQAKKNAESLGVADNAYVDPFGNIQKLFNVVKYPVTFIVNKKYMIQERFDGYTPENIKKIKKLCGLKE